MIVSLRAPRELDRYVFSPGGRSESLDQAGGEEGLLEEYGWEGPEERAPWGEDAAVDGVMDSRTHKTEGHIYKYIK